jgi:hypothetical protein
MLMYLKGSMDPADQFVRTALAKVRETAALSEGADANSSAQSWEIRSGREHCAAFERFLVLLSESPSGKAVDDALAVALQWMNAGIHGWRLEEISEEMRRAGSSAQAAVTASAGGQVIVS